MQNENIKSFMPFDSLKGFYDEIDKAKEKKESKRILSEDTLNMLNEKIKQLSYESLVKIIYYNNYKYVEVIDNVKKVDYVYKRIILKNSIIHFNNISDIEIK